MTRNFRHDLLNSIVIIKRLIKSTKPTIEQLIDDKLAEEGSNNSLGVSRSQLEMLKQSLSILEKEADKLSKICDTIPSVIEKS